MIAQHPKQGSSIYDLDTPTTLIDLDRMERNIQQWQAGMNKCGVKFRPHIKTHKIPEIARLQVAAGACGIVCAKVSEAEPFADDGINDICIAYPVVGEMKWRRIAELAKSAESVTVNCDCEDAARGLSEALLLNDRPEPSQHRLPIIRRHFPDRGPKSRSVFFETPKLTSSPGKLGLLRERHTATTGEKVHSMPRNWCKITLKFVKKD